MTIKKSNASLASKLESDILGEPLSFGAAVESLRIGLETSQSAFAKKLGVSRQYLCDVEKGRKLVSPEQAARFAKVFGHPMTVFVRLALQDTVRASGLKLRVIVEAA